MRQINSGWGKKREGTGREAKSSNSYFWLFHWYQRTWNY